ncbi:MotA/TolQ/ExbB proton channel family protein [filamentous cyanobacterium LEGE 11480]|uniref:MotA/TolQ/ExbB proton channel family protein n=1 Tax=Romeriopsis navalis LEGE 11480 TaxID=2777977 RepID=A0A928VRW7_9CYAN|nr:MotA/TolQ/ExbB proton channel family protein [Romeriopsis navalis]MBE9033360.1 MotA/TolQ/ExbB proton channel family protein [Romeriopsis navalis LEGE 11480]
MSALFDLVVKGGPVMIPMVGLSVATLACGLERGLFWARLLLAENKIAQDVLTAAKYSLTDARTIARRSADLPIGRFLFAPLKLNRPTPETFRLALETSAEDEFAKMRKGDSVFESTIAISPLLGLLGTVTGLIRTFLNLNIGGGGASSGDLGKAASGIGEALVTTAAGVVVAIHALGIMRVFVTLQTQQQDYFTNLGGELELIYRQDWYEPAMEETARIAASGQKVTAVVTEQTTRSTPNHDVHGDGDFPISQGDIQPLPSV